MFWRLPSAQPKSARQYRLFQASARSTCGLRPWATGTVDIICTNKPDQRMSSRKKVTSGEWRVKKRAVCIRRLEFVTGQRKDLRVVRIDDRHFSLCGTGRGWNQDCRRVG